MNNVCGKMNDDDEDNDDNNKSESPDVDMVKDE